MNRQDFDKWVDGEYGRHFTYYPTNDAIKSAIKVSANRLYNLLTDYSQEQELKELHSIVENLKRELQEKEQLIEKLHGIIKEIN